MLHELVSIETINQPRVGDGDRKIRARTRRGGLVLKRRNRREREKIDRSREFVYYGVQIQCC